MSDTTDDLVQEVKRVGRYVQPIIDTVNAISGRSTGGGSGASYGKGAPAPITYESRGSTFQVPPAGGLPQVIKAGPALGRAADAGPKVMNVGEPIKTERFP